MHFVRPTAWLAALCVVAFLLVSAPTLAQNSAGDEQYEDPLKGSTSGGHEAKDSAPDSSDDSGGGWLVPVLGITAIALGAGGFALFRGRGDDDG